MSALSDRIADEHTYQAGTVSCSCGELFEITTDPAVDRRDHAIHLADVTERAVRDTIAQSIEAQEARHNKGCDPRSDMFVARHAAYHFAARIVREGTTP